MKNLLILSIFVIISLESCENCTYARVKFLDDNTIDIASNIKEGYKKGDTAYYKGTKCVIDSIWQESK